MPGNIVKCEAIECVNNVDGRCTASDIWITDQHKCESYETEEET